MPSTTPYAFTFLPHAVETHLAHQPSLLSKACIAIDASMTNLKWNRTKVSEALVALMDDAVTQLSQMRNEQFQRVTHMYGEMYVATIDGVVIFTAGTRTRPSKITAIALDQNAVDKIFVLDNLDDVHACCDYLGIEERSERKAFFDFVTPRSKQ